LPAFKHLFETRLKLGEYQGHPLRKFTFNEKGKKFCFGKDTDLSKETIIELWSAWEQSREDKRRDRLLGEMRHGQETSTKEKVLLLEPCRKGG